jgi:hypothetical protein
MFHPRPPIPNGILTDHISPTIFVPFILTLSLPLLQERRRLPMKPTQRLSLSIHFNILDLSFLTHFFTRPQLLIRL